MCDANHILRSRTLQISLPSDLREIAAAAEKIGAFCAAHDLAPAIAHAVNLSIDELLTNTIAYGYDDDGGHRIEIALRLEVDALTVEITDDGRPFDPSSARMPDTNAALEDRAVGGLGIFMVRQMMDSLQYRRCGGRNITTLTKLTKPSGEGE